MIFREVAAEWLDYYSDCVKSITLEGHRAKLNKFNRKYGGLEIDKITKLDVQQYIMFLNKQCYAKDTIKKHKLTVQMVYDFAIDMGYVNYNPAYKVRIPINAPITEKTALSNEEICIVKDNVKKHDMGLFALFILYTGMRRSEALAIQWKDIDFENNRISINKVLTYENNNPCLVKKLKNGSTERKIPILTPLRPYLVEIRGKRNDYLFLNDGHLFTKSAITSRWRSYQNFTGLSVTPHQFRHTFATLAHRAGVDAKVTQKLLGHKTIKMTMEVYTHLNYSDIETGNRRLDDYVSNL